MLILMAQITQPLCDSDKIASTLASTTKTRTDVVKCCTFEVEVKGVMFYKGYLELNPARFQRVIFTRDYKNSYHTRAYWVKLAETSIRLGHLSRGAAEAWYYVSKIPTVQYLG